MLLSPEVMAKRLEDLRIALDVSNKTAADLLFKYTWLPLINIEVAVLSALALQVCFLEPPVNATLLLLSLCTAGGWASAPDHDSEDASHESICVLNLLHG